MKKYKIVPITFPWSGETKYKAAVRKRFLGLFGYWVYIDDKERWDSEMGEYRVKFFESEEEALKHVKTVLDVQDN